MRAAYDLLRADARTGQAPSRTAIGERGDTWGISMVDFPSCTFQVFDSSDCHGGVQQWDSRYFASRFAAHSPIARLRHAVARAILLWRRR